MTADALLERVRNLSRIDEDCWIWHGATNGGAGTPCIGIGRKSVPVRRLLWKALRGYTPTRNQVAVTTCGNNLCVSLEHIEIISRATLAERGRANGRMSIGAHHRHATLESNRNRPGRTLNLDKARAIRARYAETGNAALVAREFGISHPHAHNVCRQKSWREATPWTI